MTEQGENRPSDRNATPTDYIQSLHEKNMRAAQKTSEYTAETNRSIAEVTRATVETNREMAAANRRIVNANRRIAILMTVIALAAIAQVVSQWYWFSRSVEQLAPALPAPTR